jgi:cyclic beta-1,2-glucan synthetase
VRRDERLILLFTPPFDRTPKDPGYIKGYLPGIRENGGQYTHAALWTIWAYAELGNAEQADTLYRLTNPIYRAETQEMADRYKVEPYVIAADVYGVPPHTGRGGWTWYTGSSGWMYRLGLEGVLGVRREDNRLRLQPSIPPHWSGYRLRYRFGSAIYDIAVENDGPGKAVLALELDGVLLNGDSFPLVDDGQTHAVRARLGQTETAPSTEQDS